MKRLTCLREKMKSNYMKDKDLNQNLKNLNYKKRIKVNQLDWEKGKSPMIQVEVLLAD